ncbi:hypothetical protein BHF71_05775 [Vulcanibacillus modesticaldus]|uniref:PKD/Chitinase domain-containing protein n=1 Tax=Vulcanibacillus modesticaldus TaxID=337097 RepID=A0A1D2YX09_9BACI|nr:PKD domain-containing protein [Vulcanibacillus modesticaldus]OEG00196.1 hypothetical protein BHF71_05775 [Vulcanibacillus modesticaldus]
MLINNIKLVSDERLIRVEGQVYSNGVWSNVSNKVYFKIVRNTPPTANFTYTPSTVYEGDTITLTDTSTDPDGNISSHLWTIKKPDGSTYTVSTQNATITNVQPGTYQVKKKVTDSAGAWDETDWVVIIVNELMVSGQVLHTTLWNQNRIKYNLSKTGTENLPRTYDVFFPGEKFILNGNSMIIDPDSDLSVESFSVSILQTGYITELSYSGSENWEGELWDQQMIKWPSQTLTFRFSASYSSGITKYTDVIIQIDDDPYWRQHTLY